MRGDVINLPILKNHSVAGVSLGFKNHLGSVKNPGELSQVHFSGLSGAGSLLQHALQSVGGSVPERARRGQDGVDDWRRAVWMQGEGVRSADDVQHVWREGTEQPVLCGGSGGGGLCDV